MWNRGITGVGLSIVRYIPECDTVANSAKFLNEIAGVSNPPRTLCKVFALSHNGLGKRQVCERYYDK